MDNQLMEARELVIKARESLRHGDRTAARQLGEQAAFLDPNLEDVWLILAASDPDPQEALAYARKAAELNPQSERARRAIAWASNRLPQAQPLKGPPPPVVPVPNQVTGVTSLPSKRAYQTAVAMPALKQQGRNWLLPALLTGTACVLLGLLAFFVLTSPAVAAIAISMNPPAPTQENLWAPAEIAKPGVPVNVSELAAQVADTPASTSPTAPLTTPVLADGARAVPMLSGSASAIPTDAPTLVPTDVPTEAPALAPTDAPTVAPEATATPGAMVMEIVADTPTSEYIPPSPQSNGPIASVGNGTRWIDVDLTNQRVYAYEGDVMVNSFIVSTGTWMTPTVTGEYKIYVKIRSGSMSGPGYYLPNVPYIMYFYKGYGLHGTYWHNNFGTPMSHGCVNLRTDEAGWLFNWASVGTTVNVHY